MPEVSEFAAAVNVSPEQLVRISEGAIQDASSKVFQSFKTQLGAKIAALKTTKQGGKRAKQRVYIQHAVPASRRYELVKAFPTFDIKFSGIDKRGGATARAMSILVVEYMLGALPVKRGKVIVYGGSLKTMIMRERTWIHCCYAGSTARVQLEMMRDDNAIGAIVASAGEGRRHATLAEKYRAGAAAVHCTQATTCGLQATAGVADLARVDTNFRQVAFFMRAHGMRFFQFSIVGNKAMELCQAGPFAELDAYVFPSDDGTHINVSYANDSDSDMSYLYTNYIELVARTRFVLDGVTYHKEFVNRIHGRLVYKVTAMDGQFSGELPEYKSWIDPDYRDMYMVHVPVLRDGGNVERSSDWSMEAFPVKRHIIDTVCDYAMRSETPTEMDGAIRRRLHTVLSNYMLAGQVVQAPHRLTAVQFRQVALVIYVTVFMRKFKDGSAVKVLAPHIRNIARLSGQGTTGMMTQYTGFVIGSVFRSVGVVTAKLAAMYREAVATPDVPMPSFSICPGYVAYSDASTSNPRFGGWGFTGSDPFHGFSNQLPGVTVCGLEDFGVENRSVATSAKTAIDPWMLLSGDAFVNDDGRLEYADHEAVAEVSSGFFSSVTKLFSWSTPDATVEPPKDGIYDIVGRQHGGVLVKDTFQLKKPVSDRPQVEELAEKVTGEHGNLKRLRFEPLVDERVFIAAVPQVYPGPVADDPVEIMRDAITTTFPLSMTMKTQDFESDAFYGSWEKTVSVIRASLNISNMQALKPEAFYLPLLAGHVRPDVKATTVNTFHAVAKRNADAPKDADQLDTVFLVERCIEASFRVYYRDGAREYLAGLPAIGPTVEAVSEWASAQSDEKLAKLDCDGEQFSFVNLVEGASRNQLMVKGRVKPSLEADYGTAVKQPQTIQYDPTGKMVATFSPVIAEKVAREQSVLKGNVLVLQGKSVDDVIRFLNGFDWRPNRRGARYYLEGDYTQYDKSQGNTVASYYLRKCELFGVLPILRDFLKDHSFIRSVASIKAGIKIWLRDQNSSGAPYTLDRNNDVNMGVMAEFLESILDMVEFIIMMGDDFIVAVRGEPDVSGWEAEIVRKYNLSIKLQLQRHGYICSMDIVHLADGHSLLVPDIIKRSVMLMDMSVKDVEKIEERHISYADGLKYVGDPRVAQYLAVALPDRYRNVLPGLTADAVVSMCKAHNTFRQSFPKFRGLWAEKKTTRFY